MISLNTGFSVNAPLPIDSRTVLSYAQMLNTNDDIMPDVYYCLCKTDGKFYIYNKKNGSNSITGRFRLLVEDFETQKIDFKNLDWDTIV